MPVSSITPPAPPPSAPPAPTPQFDSSMFLQLLTTQLQHQNPLDPMNPTEFTGQLATYSALEQQIQTNTTLSTVVAQLSSLGTFAAISYLGAGAEIEGATAPFQQGAAGWSYSLPVDATSVQLTVTDASGAVVYAGAAPASAGAHAFALSADDFNRPIAQGEALSLSVAALDADGSAIDAAITSFATITSLDSLGADAAYQAGAVSFTAEDIIKLFDAAS